MFPGPHALPLERGSGIYIGTLTMKTEGQSNHCILKEHEPCVRQSWQASTAGRTGTGEEALELLTLVSDL